MTGMNVRSFNAALSAFSARIPIDVGMLQRLIALQILRGVVLKTPVETGRARGAWMVSVNKPPTGEPGSSDKSGSQAMAQGGGEIAASSIGDVIWIANNVPYIVFLENGTSTQAPRGMLRVTLAEVAHQF